MDPKLRELSSCRLQKAKQNLEVVETLIREGYYNFAVNRSYYAAFDAMRAVNALDCFDSSKHSGVIAHFNQFYVKTGKFPADTSTIIKKASTLREKSDYEDFFEASETEAVDTFLLVKQFLAEVEQYLSRIAKFEMMERIIEGKAQADSGNLLDGETTMEAISARHEISMQAERAAKKADHILNEETIAALEEAKRMMADPDSKTYTAEEAIRELGK